MRVLITGDNGYIGSVLVPCLMRAGLDVVGLDTGYFENCILTEPTVQWKRIRADIRDLVSSDLCGFDAVIHLAALSNDPIGNLNARWTEEINVQATERLAAAAKEAGVRRFLFSSSCIMYGSSETAVVTEESPLDPKTEYARSKVVCERLLTQLASESFSPTYLRNGTIYGLSPRMRFDTVVNNLVGSAITTGRVTVYSDGAPWRPVVNVQDVARAFLTVLQAPTEIIHNQAFNTGTNFLNCRIIEIAETVAATVKGCTIEVLDDPGADQRTYRTDFSKFAIAFPHFHFEYPLERGVRELYAALKHLHLTAELFADRRFTRLKSLYHLLSSSELDDSLRWTKSALAVSGVERSNEFRPRVSAS